MVFLELMMFFGCTINCFDDDTTAALCEAKLDCNDNVPAHIKQKQMQIAIVIV